MTQEDVGVWPPRPTLPLVSPSSGCADLNRGPHRPERCALTKLRYIPVYYVEKDGFEPTRNPGCEPGALPG